ncbi:hypothetical protein [Pseudooceanicola algae]|uniref:Phage integrase family protein n=1 Tax=Pseudooceanicola algae TaxID=1537215 RepID=A0A418SK76_9RHOB|nr:hypothetical protein [Pseudooceanicola algae]QPM89129.1 hypothetical protein PSAL_003400 [Pseudooceanicola algae]
MSRIRKPIADKVTGLRQRQRADGTWRVWWEPSTQQRDLGISSIELDAERPGWTITQARRLANRARQALKAGKAPEDADQIRRGGRTIGALIGDYRRDELPDREPATQRSYRGWLQIIEDKWADELATDITHGVMYRWAKTLQRERGATQAKRVIAMMSILMAYAERIEWRPQNSNPCSKLGIAVPEPRRRIVSGAELAALEAAAEALGDDRARATADAMRLSLFQGQRQTDVLAARVSAFRRIVTRTIDGDEIVERTNWVWIFTRSKRKTEGALPVHPENLPLVLRRVAQAEAAGDMDIPLLPGRNGLWTLDEFQKDWQRLRNRAAEDLPSCATIQYRDLRRTGSVWARQGGATKDDVGDVLGNTAAQNAQLMDTYMPASFETASRAIGAIRRPHDGKEKP